MVYSTLLQLLAASLAFTSAEAGQPAQAWKEGKFKTLVTFGDSYTDETRLSYFTKNGAAPPVGWDEPVVCTRCPGTNVIH